MCFLPKKFVGKLIGDISQLRGTIPGGKSRGGIVPGDVPIPPGIDGNLFHFEMELFLFKME